MDKLREIYFIENVKFHLDVVKGLGTFGEIEAIDTGGIPVQKLREQHRTDTTLFGIHNEDNITLS